jgi:hypothetical protein
MAAMPDFPRDELDPSGLGHDLLVDWAPWARDDSDERHSWAVKPRIDHGHHGTPPDEFWVVDKIVAPHRRDETSYWKAVSRYYLGERSYEEIARDIGRDWSVNRVRINLVAFCALVEREFGDWQDEERRVAASIRVRRRGDLRKYFA